MSALANLYFAPREGFEALLPRPRVWIPLLGWMVLVLAFTGVWLSQVDAREYMRAQLEESGQADKMPPEQQASIVEAQAKAFPVMAWVGPLVFLPIMLFVIAGVYLFVFRFLFGGDVTYGQSAAILAWTFLVVGLVTTPLTLLVLGLKEDWTIDPRVALQANPTLFLDRAAVPKPLYSLADSLDLFSFWMLGLMAAGFGVANKRTTQWALWGVAGVWAVYVLAKVALAAVF